MCSPVDELYSDIELGRSGKNMGLSTGIKKLDSYIGGIQKKNYYLIFGLSGAGKTSFVLYMLYRMLKDNDDSKFLLVYFSLEMSSKLLMAKLLSLYLWETYKIVVSYKRLMSWDSILDNDTYQYVQSGKEWLLSISKHLVIYDKALNRDIFYHTMMSVLEDHGHFTETSDGKRKIYIPNNPDLLILGIVDPVNLVFPKAGATKKEEIDAISAYAVTLREKCDASFFFLQQENRNSSGMDRRKAEMTESSAEDLKDSGNTYNDATICLAVYYPLKHKLKTCHGYPIIVEGDPTFNGLRDRYRGICLIKNRNGESEKYISTNFLGEIGLFRELPKAEDIADYSQYLHLNQDFNQQEDEVEIPKKEIIFNF